MEIQWAHSEILSPSSYMYAHMLMSFIGGIGNVMTETGLADVISAAFAGVHQVLIGKKFPM